MQRNNGVLGSVCIEAKKMRPSGRIQDILGIFLLFFIKKLAIGTAESSVFYCARPFSRNSFSLRSCLLR